MSLYKPTFSFFLFIANHKMVLPDLCRTNIDITFLYARHMIFIR